MAVNVNVPTERAVEGRPVTYLALGDSYTIGESVPEMERWSVQLAAMLRAQGVAISDPDIIARTGWTTAELADAIEKHGNTRKYSMVSLLIGVNNQYRGQHPERYRTELRALLQTAIGFADGHSARVFMLSIPDWGVTPFAADRDPANIAAQIDAFNAVAVEECRRAGIAFVDITPLSRKAAGDASLVASDQLHFSGRMYQQWAERALPVAKKIVR